MVSASVSSRRVQRSANDLREADIHLLLSAPDGLADLLSKFDSAEAAGIIESLAGHLDVATQIDTIGFIDQLTVHCADDEGTERTSIRSLSRAVAALVARCMQFVDEEDAEIIIEFVSSAPLIYGFDLLCNVGPAHGLVRGSTAKKLGRAKRHIAYGKAIEHAIEVWRQRAKRVIESGYVMEEGDLFVFLDGLARLGAGATDADALAALGEFCSEVPGGFAHFLERARKC